MSDSKIPVAHACESCCDRPGQINSTYWKIDNAEEGCWVCFECEGELENEYYEDLLQYREEIS